MSSTLQADELREVGDPDSLVHPGDFYLRNVPMYNSAKSVFAIVLECPFCGRDMMSTASHRITLSRFPRLRKLIGLSSHVTIRPRLECPHNPKHSFLITKGKIVAVK